MTKTCTYNLTIPYNQTCGKVDPLDSHSTVICPVVANAWSVGGCSDLAAFDQTFTYNGVCFGVTNAYVLHIIITNYVSGSVHITFGAADLGTYSSNADFYYYFGNLSGATVLTFSPTNFIGCANPILEIIGDGWVNNGGWLLNSDGTEYCSAPGTNTHFDNPSNSITTGVSYTCTVSVVVTTGSIILHIGGTTQTFFATGTYTFSFVALIDDECYFVKGAVGDSACVVAEGFTVCEITDIPDFISTQIGGTVYTAPSPLTLTGATAIQTYLNSLGFGQWSVVGGASSTTFSVTSQFQIQSILVDLPPETTFFFTEENCVFSVGKCCFPQKNAELIAAKNNGDDIHCLQAEVEDLWIMYDLLKYYIPIGDVLYINNDDEAVLQTALTACFTDTLNADSVIDGICGCCGDDEGVIIITPPTNTSVIYYGRSTLTTLTNTQVQALSNTVNQVNFAGIYNYIALASNYIYICYPTSFGTPTRFADLVGGFDIIMNSSFTVTINGISYTCWRSYNQLGAAQILQVIQ